MIPICTRGKIHFIIDMHLLCPLCHPLPPLCKFTATHTWHFMPRFSPQRIGSLPLKLPAFCKLTGTHLAFDALLLPVHASSATLYPPYANPQQHTWHFMPRFSASACKLLAILLPLKVWLPKAIVTMGRSSTLGTGGGSGAGGCCAATVSSGSCAAAVSCGGCCVASASCGSGVSGTLEGILKLDTGETLHKETQERQCALPGHSRASQSWGRRNTAQRGTG